MRSVTSHAASVRSIMVQDSQIALRVVQTWLVLGSVALLCVPALRGSSEWFGWLPFWLVVAPIADLLILRWRDVVGVSRKALAHLRRRHQAPRRAISRRLKQPRAARRSRAQAQFGHLLTALLNR